MENRPDIQSNPEIKLTKPGKGAQTATNVRSASPESCSSATSFLGTDTTELKAAYRLRELLASFESELARENPANGEQEHYDGAACNGVLETPQPACFCAETACTFPEGNKEHSLGKPHPALKDDDPFDLSRFPPFTEYLGPNWRDLGRQLCIPEPFLTNISQESSTNQERCHAVISKWQKLVGKKATNGVFEEALHEIGRQDIIDMLGLSNEKKVFHLRVLGSLKQTTGALEALQLCEDQQTKDTFLLLKLNGTRARQPASVSPGETGKNMAGSCHSEEKISSLRAELENIKEQVGRINQFLGVKELEQDGIRASVQLENCDRLSSMVQEVCTTLLRRTADLRRQVGRSDKESWAVQTVQELTITMEKQHKILGSRLERLEQNGEEWSEPGEQEKFSNLKRKHRGQGSQIGRMWNMFASFFNQQWRQGRSQSQPTREPSLPSVSSKPRRATDPSCMDARHKVEKSDPSWVTKQQVLPKDEEPASN